jgi:hypothetical protein
MNEEPKSIWKKSWTGWSWLRAWLIVVVATFFIVLVVTLLIPGGPRVFSDWWPALGFTLVVSVVAAVSVGLLAFIRCVCCWRNFKRFLFGVACLATFIALFYTEEDWRGWHTWNKFKQEWEAKGEHFNFASMVPPPVPDDQNFALTPVVASSYLYILDKNGHRINPQNTNVVNQLGMTIYGDADWKNWPTNGYWAKGTKTDLNVWQRYYRLVATKTNLFPVPAQPQSPAEDVLVALSKYDSVIEELREASRLPGSRFPLNYDSESPSAILLPHLAALKKCSQTLQLRSLAELQNGQPEKALADVKLALQLTDKIRTEPFLISHLVRIAMLQITLQPVWEGLAEHRWSEEQLVALDGELAKLDFLTDYKLSMRGEMGCQGGEMDRLRRHPEQLQNLSGYYDDEGSGNRLSFSGGLIARLIPAGWFYQNRLNCARMMVEYYIPLADVNQQIISPAAVRHADEALRAETKKTTPYNILEKMLLPALGNAAKKFAYAQESVDLVRVAIALERFRLAHGENPEALDALSPQFIAKLPHDIINGQPLHYRRTDDGQFVLYSVGWNETDDGGVVETKVVGVTDRKTRTPIWDINQVDWVWRYPAK